MIYFKFTESPYPTPLNLPKGETSDLRSGQNQDKAPLLWRGKGRSNNGGSKMLHHIFSINYMTLTSNTIHN
jgi:hypothetical protein